MEPEVQIVLSGALTFGVPLALAVRELLVLKRGGSGFGRFPYEPAEPTPPPLPDGESLPPRLPECLIPALPPDRPLGPALPERVRAPVYR